MQCFNKNLHVKKDLTLLHGLRVRTKKHRKDMGFFSQMLAFNCGSICLSAVPSNTIHAVRIQLEALQHTLSDQLTVSKSPLVLLGLRRIFRYGIICFLSTKRPGYRVFDILAYSRRHVLICVLVCSLPPPSGRFIH